MSKLFYHITDDMTQSFTGWINYFTTWLISFQDDSEDLFTQPDAPGADSSVTDIEDIGGKDRQKTLPVAMAGKRKRQHSSQESGANSQGSELTQTWREILGPPPPMGTTVVSALYSGTHTWCRLIYSLWVFLGLATAKIRQLFNRLNLLTRPHTFLLIGTVCTQVNHFQGWQSANVCRTRIQARGKVVDSFVCRLPTFSLITVGVRLSGALSLYKVRRNRPCSLSSIPLHCW